MLTPYYEHAGITIYRGDCREIIPQLNKDDIKLVLTDPPYPDYYTDLYQQTPIDFLDDFACKQLVFWSAKTDFPLNFTAIHIWDKKTGAGSMYERIFERHGGAEYRVYRHYLINSSVAASFTKDTHTGHKSQKPIALIQSLVQNGAPYKERRNGIILDPFMGSGTTLRAAKTLGHKAIGIEVDERWCEIAAQRLSQEVLI